jgi:T5orf172 domain
MVLKEVIPSIRKTGKYELKTQLESSKSQLAIKDAKLQKARETADDACKRATDAEIQKKIAELRAVTLHRLQVAYQERTRSQVFYICTSLLMGRDNEFKIGGVENRSLLKKRLAMYNTGSSGVHPEMRTFFVHFVEVSNYKQMESRMKELLAPFRSKRNPNSENFNLHFDILRPLTEIVSDNYNEEIERLNDFVKALLDTFTQNYIDPVRLVELDPDNIPAHFNITITKREFGTTETRKIKASELTDDELKVVLAQVIETFDHQTIKRVDIEKAMENTFVIESNKRRIWDVSKILIADIGKISKY